MALVLIVEDNDDLVTLYQTAFSGRGHETVEARTASRLMELLQTPDFAPDGVVLDLELADALSLRAVDYIRGEPRLKQTRIFVVTANENFRERLSDSVDAYLVKPIAISHLMNLVDTLGG